VTEWLLLLAAVLLVAANALFVAAEFSFITVDRATVERRAEAGDRGAGSLLKALTSLSTQLSGAQLGITVTSLVVGFIAEPALAVVLRDPIDALGLSEGAARGVSVTVALAVATGFQMVFGELVPKNWAIAEPLRLGRVVAGPQRGFTAATRPLIDLLNGSANRILRLMGVEPTEELASARSPEELASLVSRSKDHGTLDATTADLVARSIYVGGRNAADVMTPRPRVHFLAAGEPVTAALEAAVRTGHSRFPVTGESFDDVVGMVHFKHAVTVDVEERPRRTLAEVMVPPREVPTSLELEPLLAELREPGLQMAVVIDEYGGTAGIVTLEDVVEEIVGEIADEQDSGERGLRQSADGSWLLDGLLRPDEASEAIGVRLPESEQADTLGGLLIEHLGHMPEEGDAVEVDGVDETARDEDGIARPVRAELAVARLDGRRVDQVRLRVLPAHGEGPAHPEGDDDE
jgi:CBS domain containing-hemolysin-like protein